jgi:hypothetical protein
MPLALGLSDEHTTSLLRWLRSACARSMWLLQAVEHWTMWPAGVGSAACLADTLCLHKQERHKGVALPYTFT